METRNVIFLSYSRADAKVRDRFVKHLMGALPRDAGLELFVDVEIEAGEEWRPAIDSALRRAAMGVFLVSVDLVTSDFVRTHELPILLDAKHRGLAELGVLFVSPTSTVGASHVVRTSDGGSKAVKLGDYQALSAENRPDRALSQLAGPGERDAILKEAAEKTVELALRRLESQSSSGRTEPGGPTLRLDVELLRDERGYSLCYRRERRDLFSGRLAEFPRGGTPGERVFRALFPGEVWSRLARELGESGVQPAGIALQVVIGTNDPELSLQPWSAISWDGRALREHGWTVAFRWYGEKGSDLASCDARLPFVLGVSDTERGLGGVAHAHALRVVLDDVIGTHEGHQVLFDGERAGAAIERCHAGVVYVYGPARWDSARGVVMEFRDQRVPIVDMITRSQHSVPAVVFANLFGCTREDAARCAWDLAKKVPLVCVRASEWRELDCSPSDPGIAARIFLERLGGGGVWQDPSVLLGGAAARYIMFWGRRELRAEYHPRDSSSELRIARHFLDRHEQREAVWGALSEMLGRGRRVNALFGIGQSGNLLEALGEQVGTYLSERSQGRPFRRLDLSLEHLETLGAHELREEVCDQLGARGGDLGAALRSASLGAGPSHLLLDFGVREAKDDRPFDADQIETLLAFLSGDLAKACPEERLVQVLICVEPRGDQRALEHSIRDQIARFVSDKFVARLLPPLKKVPIDELVSYLTDHGGVDETLTDKLYRLAEWLLAKTGGGVFEKLVREIDLQQRGRWAEAAQALNGE